ncbi:uncharacterized protein LOC126664100 [Mercurialis annua]|uniref:uncharacterized protein LOC126664100 n=1 Tax=Mercurialis annua TaxID=3986 RepID=UPI0021602153|nr:uncharacterized protein LOC126664100 [Mercurialis annua]XP_050212430.1 uncharacterized protein LOC126664100 [Mercurialis annua]XP_055962128.1 uncharacterized protein LOC126664100 [Mercurialis annua]
MAQVLNINPISCLSRSHFYSTENGKQSWVCLQQQLKCHPKFTCIFSGNNSSRREEQARKSLESALGGKKNEFEKWNKEIKKREEAGGGANSGGGGWFGWGGRFGWSNGDNFWSEAQQTGLTVLAILAMYLVVAKGEVMLAVIVNTALKALRGTRNGFSLITSTLLKKTSPESSANFDDMSNKPVLVQASAKERVQRKWGSD